MIRLDGAFKYSRTMHYVKRASKPVLLQPLTERVHVLSLDAGTSVLLCFRNQSLLAARLAIVGAMISCNLRKEVVKIA